VFPTWWSVSFGIARFRVAAIIVFTFLICVIAVVPGAYSKKTFTVNIHAIPWFVRNEQLHNDTGQHGQRTDLKTSTTDQTKPKVFKIGEKTSKPRSKTTLASRYFPRSSRRPIGPLIKIYIFCVIRVYRISYSIYRRVRGPPRVYLRTTVRETLMYQNCRLADGRHGRE